MRSLRNIRVNHYRRMPLLRSFRRSSTPRGAVDGLQEEPHSRDYTLQAEEYFSRLHAQADDRSSFFSPGRDFHDIVGILVER